MYAIRSYYGLVKDRPGYIGYIIMHHFHLVDAWSKLDEAVVKGTPVQTRSHGEEVERESFQMGMFNLAMAVITSYSIHYTKLYDFI